MKKTWLLAALFALLGAGTWYVLTQKKNQTSSRNATDMDFAVKDASQIHKVFLADRTGRTATIVRQPDGSWLYNDKWKARPTAAQNLIETLTRINVNYVPPKAAEEVMVKSLATDAVTVEVWNKDGERIKRYYVGGVTNDERGTFAIMEGAEQPYVVHMPGFVGQLRVRYLLGDDDWRDRNVFEEKPEEIQSVTVDYPGQKFQSFRLEKTGEAQFAVRPLHPDVPASPNPMRKGVAEGYVLQFEKLGAEAFETKNPKRDSVTATTPFAIVSLKKTDGTEKSVRFFPWEVEIIRETGEPYVHRFWADASWGDFYLTQDRVFEGVFRGYSYFFGGNGKPPSVRQ